jgi:hypothetical protein
MARRPSRLAAYSAASNGAASPRVSAGRPLGRVILETSGLFITITATPTSPEQYQRPSKIPHPPEAPKTPLCL